MIITDDGCVVLEEDERYVTTYVCYHDQEILVMAPDEALDFVRQQIYETTRAPSLSRWQYDVGQEEWQHMEEHWEVSDDG